MRTDEKSDWKGDIKAWGAIFDQFSVVISDKANTARQYGDNAYEFEILNT